MLCFKVSFTEIFGHPLIYKVKLLSNNYPACINETLELNFCYSLEVVWRFRSLNSVLAISGDTLRQLSINLVGLDHIGSVRYGKYMLSFDIGFNRTYNCREMSWDLLIFLYNSLKEALFSSDKLFVILEHDLIQDTLNSKHFVLLLRHEARECK